MSSKVPASISLSPEAYSVLFMHCCKYPHRAVNGLLLGSTEEGTVRVREALPLFHSPLSLSPMLEAALLLASEYCTAKSLKIVGYYQANEIAEDLDLGPFGRKIAEKIRAQSPVAAVLLLDGARMRPKPDDLRLLAINADGKRANAPPTIAPDVPADAIERLEGAMEAGQQHELVDFDVHLDDPAKDWTGNAALVAPGA